MVFHIISFCNLIRIHSFGFNFFLFITFLSNPHDCTNTFLRIQLLVQYSNWTNREWSIKWAYYVMHLLYSCTINECIWMYVCEFVYICWTERDWKWQAANEKEHVRKKNFHSHSLSQEFITSLHGKTGMTLFTFHSKFNECSVWFAHIGITRGQTNSSGSNNNNNITNTEEDRKNEWKKKKNTQSFEKVP